MERFTKDELLQEIAAGNCTTEGLAAKFELTARSVKSALAKLGISLEKREPEPIDRKPEPIIKNDSSASVEDEWDQLYKDYDLEGAIGTQAQFIIAQCKISYGMTAAQARQYMEDNFHYQVIEIKLSK